MAWVDLIGRILISLLFVAGVGQKATDPAAVQGLLAGFVGPGVVLQVFGLSVAIAFVILWLTALREAERDLATGR